MAHDLDFLDHLRRESARFVEALQDAPPDARVPTCPDWDADDLLWHLGGVQWFWGQVVAQRVTDGDEGRQARRAASGRPAARGCRRSTTGRAPTCAATWPKTDPTTTVWTWSAEQSAGFIRRRQAHEALVHRLDAELTAGNRTPFDPALAADGVDEALRVMYGGCPPWGTITPEPGRTMRLRATDTGDTWLVTLARFTGTDPQGHDLRRAGHLDRRQRPGRRRGLDRERLRRGPQLLALAPSDHSRPRPHRRPHGHRDLRDDDRQRHPVALLRLPGATGAPARRSSLSR